MYLYISKQRKNVMPMESMRLTDSGLDRQIETNSGFIFFENVV